ncbi:MAG TPA: hypothetical protein VFL66_03715 [Gaiellaceae bacterium]|nr:hypothetical protein [Gaiellaceae bacterium]
MLNFHFRPPSVDHGVISFLWGIALGIFIWFGLRAIGVGNAESFMIAAVSAFAIFLFVRVYGEDEPRRP